MKPYLTYSVDRTHASFIAVNKTNCCNLKCIIIYAAVLIL